MIKVDKGLVINSGTVRRMVPEILLELISKGEKVKIKKSKLSNGMFYWLKIGELKIDSDDSKSGINGINNLLITFKYIEETEKLYVDFKGEQVGERVGDIDIKNVMMGVSTMVYVSRLLSNSANEEKNEKSTEEKFREAVNEFCQREGMVLEVLLEHGDLNNTFLVKFK